MIVYLSACMFSPMVTVQIGQVSQLNFATKCGWSLIVTHIYMTGALLYLFLHVKEIHRLGMVFIKDQILGWKAHFMPHSLAEGRNWEHGILSEHQISFMPNYWLTGIDKKNTGIKILKCKYFYPNVATRIRYIYQTWEVKAEGAVMYFPGLVSSCQ